MHFGWQEIILIVLVVLLLFGARKIPDLARGLGKGINEFKKGIREIESPETSDKDDKEKKDSKDKT